MSVDPVQRKCLATLLMLLCGCGGSGRLALQGTVTLDEEPIEKGVIQFVPLPGTKGPSAGGTITNGAYLVIAENGVLPGRFRVEITASQATGRQLVDRSSAERIAERTNYVPARYNVSSELTSTVTVDGPNRFDFSLQSDAAASR